MVPRWRFRATIKIKLLEVERGHVPHSWRLQRSCSWFKEPASDLQGLQGPGDPKNCRHHTSYGVLLLVNYFECTPDWRCLCRPAPLSESMTSSTKPEIYNLLHCCCQSRTEGPSHRVTVNTNSRFRGSLDCGV